MQSVFANLPKRKYKPVDLKAFDEAISEGISRERNSSQNPNAMHQHDEFAGVGRGASRGRGHYNQTDRYGDSYTQGTPGFGRGRGYYNQADSYGDSYIQGMPGLGRGRDHYNQADGYGHSYTQGTLGFGRGRDHYNQADSYGYSYTQGTPGFGRGRGQYNQADRAVSGGLFQKSANFNNTNRNHSQDNQGNQDDDSYMQDVEIFDQCNQGDQDDDSYMQDAETFGQYNQTYGHDSLYVQNTEGFGKGRASNTNFSKSFNNEYGNATQPSKEYAYQSHPLQGQRNDNIFPQSTPVFGRGRGAFLSNNNIQETFVQPKERRSSNIFDSTGPIIKNEYDGHASMNTGGPARGFGALSNNINTQGWYAQSDEKQIHQPFVSRQSTLEHQIDNQNAPAKSGFNKSRLGFNNNKGQRNFDQPSEKSLASRQSTSKPQNDNANLSSNSGLGRGRKGLENRGCTNISQPSEGSLQVQSKNQAQNRSQVQNKNQAQTVTAENRAARFGTTSKSEVYAQMKKNRVVEREQAIKDGLIPDPNAPHRLEDAIDFRGTCETKCPEFEMIEREIQNNVDRLEMDENGNLNRNKAVKAYRRSAAGNDQPLPADVRSPEALIPTLDYLIEEVMSTYPLEKCHAFIRDRTRSIRQDFTLQNIRDVTAVEVHERIARFHILCLHEMCGLDESKFSEQQETEQLRKVLLSLMEFYEDLREEDIETPNEAEFRAYYIITHIRDKDVARQISSQPAHIFKHPYVKQALKFYAMAQRSNEIEETPSRRNKAENAFGSQSNYASFFKLVADPHTSFLMACLLETHFPEVRKGALKAMNVAYMARSAGVEAEHVRKVLCYDSLAQCLKEAKHYGIGMDMSLKEPTLLFGLKHYESRARVFLEPLSYLAQRKSVFLVEAKKDGKSFSEIVNGYEAIDEQSAPITHAALYAQHKVPNNESEAQHKPATKAFELQRKRDLLMKRTQEAEALVAKERKKLQELINLRSIKPKKVISQVDGKSKVHAQRRMPEYYCSDWCRSDFASTTLKRARLEDEYLVEEQQILEEQRAVECRRRIEKERRLEEQQRLEERRKIKEEMRVQAIKRRNERKQRREERRQRLDRRMQKLEEKQKMMEKRKEIMEERIRELQNINEQKIRLLCAKLPEPSYYVDSKTRVKKQFELMSILKKKAGVWLRRARDRITKRNVEHRILKSKRELSWVLMKNNPYCKFDYPKSNIPKFNGAERDKIIQQSLAADHVVMENEKVAEYNKNSVWNAEDFGLGISRRILRQIHDLNAKHPDISQKINWQLIICTEDTQLQSSAWFKRKFNLDDEFLRNVDHYTTLSYPNIL
ncbi:hypothetical protein G6F46_010335 [Rhizopus delemar]|nr:hypothetical protein G6F46_010335 [Rhizopus delemar]